MAQYETTISIAAGKAYADGKGNEKQAQLDEQIDVGVFTAQPGDPGFDSEQVVSMQRSPIRSGEQQVRIVTKVKPLYAGVDPYMTFIDRNSNDNIERVSDSAERRSPDVSSADSRRTELGPPDPRPWVHEAGCSDGGEIFEQIDVELSSH